MTRQFVKDNYDLLKNSFDLWLHDAANNSQYGSGIFGGGDVRELEKLFCKLFHSKYALVVSSGTAALHTSLISLNVKRNSRVIILGSNWIGLSALVISCGARPVFVEPNNFVSFINVYWIKIKEERSSFTWFIFYSPITNN